MVGLLVDHFLFRNSIQKLRSLLPYGAIIIFIISAVIKDFSHRKWKNHEVLTYDVWGYYNYLPALILYHDFTHYHHLDSLEKKYTPTQGLYEKYGLHRAAKTGYWCNQYPMGVAFFQAPFFLIAHAWSVFTKQDAADGYSSPYQHAVVLSTLVFAILSLFLLIRFLEHYFSPPTIFFTILLLVFATNFYHYATLESGTSHIYMFFLYCSILYITRTWYQKPTLSLSVFMGLVIGLAIITRPIDILIVIIPLTWLFSRKHRIQFLLLNKKQILLIMLTTWTVCLPQILYWKFVTGDWIYYSYSEFDYFRFDRFRVLHGLFSYRKGWFLYTPIAFWAFIQAFHLNPSHPLYFYKRTFWIFYLPMIYLVFSWNNWFYGWSFSCRALLGTLPLLSIPIAILLERISVFKLWKKWLHISLLTFLTFLNLFQTWQFEHGILHGTLMNEATYWKLLFKIEKPRDLDKNFVIQEEIDKNNGGW